VGVDVGATGVGVGGIGVDAAVGDTANATFGGGWVGDRIGEASVVGVGAGADEQATAYNTRTSANASETTLFINPP
jgi:hypothetical protein